MLAKEPIFSTELPDLNMYQVFSEDEEVLLFYDEEVEQVIRFLKDEKFDLFFGKNLFADKYKSPLLEMISFSLVKLLKVLRSDEDIILLAIAFWQVLKFDKIGSLRSFVQKVAGGGDFYLSEFFEPGAHISCIDSACLTQVMAARFGIKGHIKRYDKDNPISHHVFVSEQGRVVDPTFGLRDGGFYLAESMIWEKMAAVQRAINAILETRNQPIWEINNKNKRPSAYLN